MSNGRAGGPIEAETLAAYIDGTLPPDERARVDAMLAEDADSYQWLLDSLRAMAAAEEAQAPAVAPIRAPSRTWITVLAGLAAAAALVLAVWFGPRWLDRVTGTTTRPSVVALVDAVGDARYIEARLTGGFRFGPLRPATRGSLGEQSIAMLAAAAPLQQVATTTPTARTLHDWGVAQVLLGDLDDGIQTLEEAVLEAPTDAGLMSDLGAAYAARARADGQAESWSKSLEWSERALRVAPALPEARFNRALSLEGLGLSAQALEAWRSYLEADPDGPWSADAQTHVTRLGTGPQGSQRPATDADLRSALDAHQWHALAPLARADTQRVREWLEEDLPGAWAIAVLAGDAATERRVAEQSTQLLAAYGAAADDPLPGVALQTLLRASGDAKRPLATALLQYSQATALVRDDRLVDAIPMMATAIPVLTSAQNPLAWWGRYDTVLLWAQQGKLAESLAELDVIQHAADAAGFTVLSGTTRNRRGQVFSRLGDQERAIAERVAAIAFFARAGDRDQVAVMHSLAAEAYRFLGDPASAWSQHLLSLQLLPQAHNYRSRHLVLVQAGLTCTFEGNYHAALAFQQAVVDNGHAWQRASGTATGLLHLARNLSRLGRATEAGAQLVAARDTVAEIPDVAFRERIGLELMEVEGEVASVGTPADAIPVLTTAIERFRAIGIASRLSTLLLQRGRAFAQQGEATRAEADWQDAVTSLERERETVSADQLRLAQAGGLRALQSEIAWARVRQNQPALVSLAPVERARARTLVENVLAADDRRAGAGDLQAALPADAGVIYYLVGADESVAWLVTRDRATVTRLDIGQAQLQRLITGFRRGAISSSAPSQFGDNARALYRALLAPLGPTLRTLTSLVIVPDPALAGVSFGALIDPDTNQFVIASTAVAVAPSGALIAQAGPSPRGGRALLVGASRPSSLPPLPWVGSEIAQLSTLYPGAVVRTGAEATRDYFLSDAGRASVIHFAGHAVGNPANPLLSRLVLHAGADGRGDLYAFELSHLTLASPIVVLSACSTGYAGVTGGDDDGVLAMARPFLARGARAVVATYWQVSDTAAPLLMAALHGHLRGGMSVPRAWQAAVRESLERSPASVEWAAYTVFLGRGGLSAVTPHLATDN